MNNRCKLRCQGWLNNSSVCLQSKNPALLSSHHQVVRLIDVWAHERVRHGGVVDRLTYF